MGNLVSTVIEAIAGKNDQNSTSTSDPYRSTYQTNNVPQSYSTSAQQSFYYGSGASGYQNSTVTSNPVRSNYQTNNVPAAKSYSTSNTTSAQQTYYCGGHQNVSTIKSSQSTNFSSSATKSAPLSYAKVANQNCSKTGVKTSNIRVSCSSPKTIISKADFRKFQQILYSEILRQCKVLNWKCNSWFMLPGTKEYQVINLEEGSDEYEDIMYIFSETVSREIYVSKIVRVENPYLMGQYNLKKLEYENKGLPVEERELFHGTQDIYIDSICRNNFDWRLHGLTEGNRFGKGVSFTPKSRYANHYCDMYDKVMIVAKVLVSSICEGHKNMTIPDYYDDYDYVRYDTSIKEPTGDVLVKYSDDEFYPAYLIYFSGEMYYHRPYPKQGFYR